jgi:hypothetical protein
VILSRISRFTGAPCYARHRAQRARWCTSRAVRAVRPRTQPRVSQSAHVHSCHTSRTHLHRVLVHPVLPPRLDSATTHSPGTARSPRSHTNVSPITHRVHDQRGSFSRWFEYTCLNRSTQSNSTIHMLTDQYTEIWRDHALSYRATNFKAHTTVIQRIRTSLTVECCKQ